VSAVAVVDELRRLDRRAHAAALRNGLEPCETIFQLASADRMYDIVARGLPGRYAHWRFGRAFDAHRAQHERGLARVYELVLNTRPAQAYLLDGNSPVMQLLVIAHVYAHVDFFCRSRHFEVTDPAFLRRVRAAAGRIERYAREHGRERVEDLLDAGTALGPHRPAAAGPPAVPEEPREPPADPYADLFPQEAAQRRRAWEDERAAWRARVPREPEEDVLGFLVREAPRLEDWERDILGICREEAAYFAPQLRTKIINEGWATYWHVAILQDLQLPADQFVEFQRATAQVVQPHPGVVNPYNLGYALWRKVQRVYDEPTDDDRERWPGVGEVSARERMQEISATYDDAAFIEEFLTDDVCEECRLFAWRRGPSGELRVTSTEAEEVRRRLVQERTAFGIPRLRITDADAFRSGGLWIEHRHEGVGLDQEYALGTLPYLARLWGRRVHLATVRGSDGQPVWYVADPDGKASMSTTPPSAPGA
jgi:stage V sporulation protein R